MLRTFLLLVTLFSFLYCDSVKTVRLNEQDLVLFEKAEKNGVLANIGYVNCNKYLNGWMSYRDPNTGLIPRNIKESRDFWNAKDAAADNYPFMVLTSFFTNREIFDGDMLDMLHSEKKNTSRIRSLPDTYSFSKQAFLNSKENKDEIVFGTSEYIKDGLLPLTEWLGDSPWSDRMLEMLDDLNEEIDIAGTVLEQGYGNAPREEVNGELLQVLSRVYWMTGNEKFLEWAIRIGDFYLLGEHHPTRDLEYLRLRDHGCELISGLCELYVTCHFADQTKKSEYQGPLYEMLDRVLDVGRNEDGFFYNAINPKTGDVVEPGIADTWGYTLNGFYGVYMIDGIERYKEAILKVFDNIDKYRNFDWERGSADGYADAIESALNLYNRIPDTRVADWIDSEIQVMWAKQQDNGIIEGWHGDGNFARTTIMYNLWKSKGLYVGSWRADLKLGAEQKGDTLFISLQTDGPWAGKLYVDKKRHQTNMNMPLDWPRINQFPEWFVANSNDIYRLMEVDGTEMSEFRGLELLSGIELNIESSQQFALIKKSP
jgi:hypothetical protein